jgi:hypothetical protein
MSTMEDLMQAALAAPPDRREDALRVLQGHARIADSAAPSVAVEQYLKDKDAIATELKAAFKLPEAQAVKITRRITGRARFFQRVGELMAAK